MEPVVVIVREIGQRGPPGPPGMGGPRGIAGSQGETGRAGPQGDVGPVGPMGGMGPRGIMGAQGPMGVTGPSGPQGPLGPPGATGPPGPALDSDIRLTPVNRANYWQSDEGLVVQTQGLSGGAVNPVGAFNGAGTGNKSIVEINSAALYGRLLSTLDRIEIVARKTRPINTAGSLFAYVNMQVQATAAPGWSGPPAGPDRVVIAPTTAPMASTFSTIVFRASDPIWTVGGAPGLGLNQGGPPLPLTGAPPTAAFYYGVVPDGGLPPVTETAPILIVTGDSSSVASRNVIIKSIRVYFTDAPPLVYDFARTT
ncbi:hypothetical protein pdul_cds_608 [Pandoravirus dulcis]|uniref:Uncharacterized protein n=1 Tax=Pandoravirus dulcis TaxID=1349409 RepID=S4VQU0_9VIRU|nr:hypothetical protein pdul_cds_608 [Pandoravirus dulcis]AGO82733.2 hypothetical protein pdul_cds_608 [Pandoravirus dulcis]